ncbi:MAG: glycosyltransferase family 2 protein [Bacteroidaceae bacterium]|nr:glycosyltransferase family 2 protein [Bacteroidaceae bacterium]
MKVSVIIPIYKVEAFIEICVTTLMEQTLQEVEYIFVDDATPDGSIQILKEVVARYPERKEQVRIVHHEGNKGLPAARNTGMELATGEYIFHCDSDDYVELTMLEEMYNSAKALYADIVWCDWYLTFAENERYMKQPSFGTPMEALKAMLSGGMKYNVWNKLVRRTLYTDNSIEFPSGYGMGEDMTMMMLFAHANKVAYIPKAYYHYVKTNANAFSQTYSDKHLQELRYNVQRIIDYMQEMFGNALEKELNFFKLDVKFPFLIGNNFKRWEEWYPEANKYILQNNSISDRSRYTQWLAFKKQYWLVWIYNQLLDKIVYGLIFK